MALHHCDDHENDTHCVLCLNMFPYPGEDSDQICPECKSDKDE